MALYSYLLIIVGALMALALFWHSTKQAGNRRYRRSERIREQQEELVEMLKRRKGAGETRQEGRQGTEPKAEI